MSVPLLILSDSVGGHTGLGRIARELANRIHSDMSDVFRVGVLGVGGNYTSRLPYPNYPIQQLQSMIPMDIPRVWQDFAGDEKGILLTIWNLSWCEWLATPERLPPGMPLREFLGVGVEKPDSLTEQAWEKLNPQMQKLLGKKTGGPFKKWLYCPVDGSLPDGTLGSDSKAILGGFDRILAYTRYGARVIEDTLGAGVNAIPNLPHGVDASVFYPRDRVEARRTFVTRLSLGKSKMAVRDDNILIGCIGTNSFRKDWGLAFETCGELLKRGKNVFLWAHTNALDTVGPMTYWNFMALARAFEMENRVVLTTHRIEEADLPWCYAACDVTLGIGSEGWGMPLGESLACGIPVVHMTYAGGSDFVPREFQVEPSGYRLEGRWMIRRPVFDPKDWADKVEFCLTPEAKELAKLPGYIDWANCWPNWKSWLQSGLEA